MSDEGATDYTNLNFLTSLRSKPKKPFPFRGMSLNTDLQQIDLILKSPRGATITKMPQPTTLDKQLTKRFVMDLLRRYEGEDEAHRKWEAFIQSVGSPPQFQKFFDSLKEIKEDPKAEETKPNPQNSNGDLKKQPERQRQRRKSRALSLEKKEPIKSDKQLPLSDKKIKQKIRLDMQQLKDLLMAGQRFIREA